MGFEIINSQHDKTHRITTTFGRTRKPEIAVESSSRSMCVLWRGSIPQGALEEAWKQTNLELVSAKCKLFLDRNNSDANKTVNTVQAIEQLVVDNAAGQPGAITSDIRVKAENETTRPSALYLFAHLGNPLTSTTGARVEFSFARKSWDRQEVQQFILNMLRKSSAVGEVTQDEVDDLAAKISQLARPKKMSKAISAIPQPAAG